MIALAAVGLAGCSTVEWHRKITVVVNTPQGEVTAYSVQRESISEKGGWWAPPEATGAERYVRGEAFVVDLGNGKYLFAILQENKPDTFHVLRPGEAPLKVAANMKTMRGAVQLNRGDYPTLVTFTDINKPASVKEVKPEDLAASFGPGYALKSMRLEITDEAVTKGRALEVLPWLKTLVSNLDGSKYSSPQLGLSNNLNMSHFSTERQK
jgi:hypothetical protein